MVDVLVLGGGFGGAQAALRARDLLGEGHRVTLVDRRDSIHLCGANPMVAVGARPAEGVSRPLSTLRDHGVEVLRDEVAGIDLDGRQVETSTGRLAYDFLVVALGAAYDWDAVPGSESAHSFYDHTRTVALREAVERFEGGRVVVAVASAPYKCPPAPLEAALVLEWHFRRRDVPADIHVFIPEPAPLAVAGPGAAARVSDLLASRGITLHTRTTISDLDSSGRRASFSDGSTLDADLVIVVPVHRLPQVVADSGLARGGAWVPVDPETLEALAAPGVFAVGDVNSVPIGSDRAIPKAGVFASAQGRQAAGVIASRVTGGPAPAPYEGVGTCFLLFSGEEVAQVGGVFLAPGGPEVALGDPQPVSAKEHWEADWRGYAI